MSTADWAPTALSTTTAQKMGRRQPQNGSGCLLLIVCLSWLETQETGILARDRTPPRLVDWRWKKASKRFPLGSFPKSRNLNLNRETCVSFSSFFLAREKICFVGINSVRNGVGNWWLQCAGEGERGNSWRHKLTSSPAAASSSPLPPFLPNQSRDCGFSVFFFPPS